MGDLGESVFQVMKAGLLVFCNGQHQSFWLHQFQDFFLLHWHERQNKSKGQLNFFWFVLVSEIGFVL